jgi:hypothetical protein
MERLCERPGCSERASVAYGMRAEDLVFWLDRLTGAAAAESGVLCQRHADTMVVPRNWTLDDLRDPDLHLFRPPAAVEQRRSRSRRSHGNESQEVEQLALGVEPELLVDDQASNVPKDNDPVVEPIPDAIAPAEMGTEDAAADTAPVDVVADDAIASADVDVNVAEHPEVWTPTFDTADDLDGLLLASSPLLARAFRGAGRPRESPGAS